MTLRDDPFWLGLGRALALGLFLAMVAEAYRRPSAPTINTTGGTSGTYADMVCAPVSGSEMACLVGDITTGYITHSGGFGLTIIAGGGSGGGAGGSAGTNR